MNTKDSGLPASQHVSVDAVAPANDSQINEKFNCLIKKIENQRKVDDGQYGQLDGQIDKQNNDDGPQEDQYNKDKTLKQLYDESVDFKNSLAQLRSQIKALNGQFNSYDLKCNQLMNEEFGEYKSLKGKIEQEKIRLEEEQDLHEKKMNEKTNRLKVMQIEFLKQYQNVAKYA